GPNSPERIVNNNERMSIFPDVPLCHRLKLLHVSLTHTHTHTHTHTPRHTHTHKHTHTQKTNVSNFKGAMSYNSRAPLTTDPTFGDTGPFIEFLTILPILLQPPALSPAPLLSLSSTHSLSLQHPCSLSSTPALSPAPLLSLQHPCSLYCT